MATEIDNVAVKVVNLDGNRIGAIKIDGQTAWPDTYVRMTAGTVNIAGSTDAFGYDDGSGVGTFGSISEDTSHDGNTIHTIYWDEINENRLRFTLDGTHAQNAAFDRIEIETESSGTQVFRPEDADLFDQNSGNTDWVWNFATQMFSVGNTYRVWIFN